MHLRRHGVCQCVLTVPYVANERQGGQVVPLKGHVTVSRDVTWARSFIALLFMIALEFTRMPYYTLYLKHIDSRRQRCAQALKCSTFDSNVLVSTDMFDRRACALSFQPPPYPFNHVMW